MAVVAPTPDLHHRDDIQGLRAVAVALVVAYHAGLPVPGGFLGVDVFFVISGFVITAMLERGGGVRLRTFFVRRVRRIVPAVSVLVVTVVALSMLLESPLGEQQATARVGLGAVLFSANLVLHSSVGGYFGEVAERNPLLHLWSLGVEEQFYVGLALLLAVAWRRRGTVLVVGGVASFVLAVALLNGVGGFSRPESLAFYASPARAWQFAAGAILALVLARRSATSGRTAMAVAVGGTLLLAVTALVVDGPAIRVPLGFDAVSLPSGLPATLAAAALVAAGALGSNAVSRGLAHPALGWVGDRSYSLYLWHWPAIVLVGKVAPGNDLGVAAAVALSVPAAAASYRWVEEPFRRGWTPSRAVLRAAALSVLALLAAGGVWRAAEAGWGDPELQRLSERAGAWEVPDPSCTLDDALVYACDEPGDPERVVLVGDSHAMALSAAFREAAGATGASVGVRAAAGCTFLVRDGDGGCDAWVDDVLTDLSADPPDVVVLHQCARLDVPCPAPPGEWTDAWAGLVRTTVDALRDTGASVVVVHDVPDFVDDLGRCTRLWGRPDGCGVEPTASLLERLQPGRTASQRALADVPGVLFVDPVPIVCPDATCSQVRSSGEVVYRDRDHLTVDGARPLVPALRQAIEQALG